MDPRRIKIHRSYTIEELARTLLCHKNSVRKWLREGLSALDDGKRPILIHGAVARVYLEERRRTAKRKCRVDELFCLRCRIPRPATIDSLVLRSTPHGSAMLSGTCAECGTQMFKRVSQLDAGELRQQRIARTEEDAPTLKQAA
jgi:hypothetical protein